MMLYILILFIVFIFIWTICVIKTNDFKVPSKDILHFKKISIVFPHPDDESLSVSGLCKYAQRNNIETTLLVLSNGEAGEGYKVNKSNLAEVRANELRKSAEIIGIKKLMQFDFPDGNLISNKNKIIKVIDARIRQLKPDLVITYDLSGLYGHEDHIVVSKIVTNLIKQKYNSTKLWYISYPKKVLDMISLPTHMAKDKNFLNIRKEPNLKVFTGIGFLYSYLSVLAHKSQYKSFRSEELKYVPLILAYSTQIYEYFYEVSNS